jgi:hypothetical protein
MEMKTDAQAIAGRRFAIDVIDDGPVHVELHVGTDLVWKHDCPDPPCHEEVIVPERYAGESLTISARSPASPEGISRRVEILRRSHSQGFDE